MHHHRVAMRLWIVHNGFIRTDKHFAPVRMLEAAAERLGVMAEAVPSDMVHVSLGCGRVDAGDRPDAVVFWDKDVALARSLEAAGIPVFNPSGAIAACDDKAMTCILLSEAGIPVPETVVAPVPSGFSGYGEVGFIDRVAGILGEPFVLKERHGSYGRQVHLFDREEAKRFAGSIGNRPFLMQRFVAESGCSDVRVHVVGGRAVASFRRRAPPGDFRSNITGGGSMEACVPTDEETGIAIRSAEVLGLDFAGVDILSGQDSPLVCEVNSNAHMENTLACTGVDVSEAIIRHVLDSMEKMG